MPAERALEVGGGRADRVEVRGAREPRRRDERLVEPCGRLLGVLDPLGPLPLPQIGEPAAQLGDVAAARALLGELAERRDRRGVADNPPVAHRPPPESSSATHARSSPRSKAQR